MKQIFQEFDPSTIRFAGGKAVPVSRVIAMYQREIATLAAMDGNFRSNVESVFPGRVASELELANVTTVMMRHRDARVRAAGARGLLQLADAGINIARYNVALQHLSGEHRARLSESDPPPDCRGRDRACRPVLEGTGVEGAGRLLRRRSRRDCRRGKGPPAVRGRCRVRRRRGSLQRGPLPRRQGLQFPPGPCGLPEGGRLLYESRGPRVRIGDDQPRASVRRRARQRAGSGLWLGVLSRAAALGDDVAVDAIAVMAAAHVPPRRRGLSAIAATRL